MTMNAIEKEMVEVLKRLAQEHGATEVKASMESEGILLDEMLRLKEIIMAAGVGMSVKIGGCEAITDARIAQGYGVSILLGPMIESRFALEKFLGVAESVFAEDEREDTKFYINIETMDGYRKLDEILSAENLPLLHAIVLGRTDLRSALKAETVDCPEMLKVAKGVFEKAKAKSLRCIVGGGITEKTVPFLAALDGLIDGFETRKVAVGRYRKEPEVMAEAIRQALTFELLWCRWEEQTYMALAREDAQRMRRSRRCLADSPHQSNDSGFITAHPVPAFREPGGEAADLGQLVGEEVVAGQELALVEVELAPAVLAPRAFVAVIAWSSHCQATAMMPKSSR